MPHKLELPNGKKSAGKPHAGSASEYSYKVETVAVQYRNGKPIQLLHPQHLASFRSMLPSPLNRGGRPSVEHTVRYVLNRALFDYLFIPQDTPPQPLTRYGLATLALKWREKEREKIVKSSAPKWDKEQELARLIVSRDTIDNFVKGFFKKKGQRLSPKDLAGIFPRLWYT